MWYVLKAANLSLSLRDELKNGRLEYYLPTHTILRNVGGQQKRVEQPLVFNFIFVRSSLDELKSFCRNRPDLRIHVVYNHKPMHEEVAASPLRIGDHQMEMFQKAISFYSGQEIPFVKPEEMELEKGDEVRIIGGQFSGLEGILVSQKGKDGGRVVVHLSNVIAVRTLEIEPEYLQILHFGKDNKHFYKHLDSFIPRLDRALAVTRRKLSAAELTPIETFVKRFSQLRTDTINSEAKVQTLLCASCTLIGNTEGAEEARQKVLKLLPRINSQAVKDFVVKYMGEQI